MEQTLNNRVKLRHAALLAIVGKAEDVKKQSETGISIRELTEVHLKLKNTIGMFEKDCLKLTECSTSLDQVEQDRYMSDQLRAEDLLMELETIKDLYSETTPSKQETYAKLPKLEIPKFNGDILKWPEFWDKFDSNIHSRSLRNVDKLSYLFGTMEGPALEALSGIDITNNNYEMALSTLKRRFGDKSLVIDAHYNALTKLPKATESNVRYTLDSILKHLRILQNMGEDTAGNFLRNLICSKFPERVIYELNLITPHDRDMTVMLEGLEKIVTSKERSTAPSTSEIVETSSTEVLQARSVLMKGDRKRKLGRDKAPPQPLTKRVKRECIFCQGSHYSDQCGAFNTYTQRVKALKDKCYRCFRAGHRANVCKNRAPCFHCEGQHHRALCRAKLSKEFRGPVNSRKTTGNNTTKNPREKPSATGKSKEDVCDARDTTSMYTHLESFLQTATVRIRHNNKTFPARLLMDSGSQRSYITDKLSQRLQLNPDRDDRLMIYTFGSNNPQATVSPSVEIDLITKRNTHRTIRVNIIPHITDKVKVTHLEKSEMVDLSADDYEHGDGIDLLLGNDYYFSFLREKRIKIKENLYLVDTDFGWIVSGFISEETNNDLSLITYCQCHDSNCPYFSEPDLPLRNVDMKFLWSLESIGIVDSPKCTREEEAVKHFNETVLYNAEGRYEVKWPWIQYPPELPSNFGLAFGRLRSILKRADAQTLKDYEEIFKEQLEGGIIERVEPDLPAQNSLPVHYLPHHIVKQSGKKGRIVYDASAKIKEEKSLNECMYRGPSLLEDLTALLLKFRTGKIAITADVEKAFLQIGLQDEDRNVTRFLWVKDTSMEPTEDNLLHYRFCRVPFGIIASPFLLTATIRHHLSKTNRNLLKKIADRCYVDNLVTEAKTRSEAYDLYRETRSAFEELAMNIRDWVSNDRIFMNSIPEEYRAKDCKEVKVLGLVWNIDEDTLQLKVPNFKETAAQKGHVTKKDVLRTVARFYDPCGYASPLVLQAKLIFQETCIRKLKWNSPLPDDLMQSWTTALENLESAKNIKIPRYMGHTLSGECEYELHCFTDASKNAYAAVVYIVLRNTETAVTAFMMSKSRVTPVEDKDDLKIPRLELLGFLIGSRLLKYVAENLDVTVDQKYLWTDSLIVLAWMKTNKLLPPFVSRRVNEIKQNKDVELRHVPTQMNPADVATRPDAAKQKQQLWLEGPEFITRPKDTWPHRSCDEQQVFCSVGEALDIVDGPEMSNKGYEGLEDITMDVDSDNVLLNDEDELKVIRDLQLKYFPDEVAGKQTHLSRNLGLFLDGDRILRCKGRMMNTDWNYDTKHPILIPKDCKFTNEMIIRKHEENYHVGVAHTLSLIRQRYWIPQGRAQVKKILKKCSRCVKHGGGPYKLPPTPALPQERVRFSKPFSFTGMDYFGPIFVKTGSTREKRWVCLFTCLAVRAIHLEVVNDLSAIQCLMGLRRFFAVRGRPNLIVSDNATQFKLTSEILTDPHCVDNNIRWKFIPQLAPWHGGIYERLIALVKNCLKRTLDKHLLDDGQLLTVIKEVEAVINTRPLTSVGSEIEHVLRPVDFLTLGNCLEVTVSPDSHLEGTNTKIDLLRSWKRGQMILSEFKLMFRNQYLLSLRERYRHHPKQPRVTAQRSPCLGDIVQIKEDSKNRNNWKVGKITELLKGQDGEYRVAKVKVGDHLFTRSIGHLYPLEEQLGEEEMNMKRKGSDDHSPIEPAADTPQDIVELELPEECEIVQPEETLVHDEPLQVDDIPMSVDEPELGVVDNSPGSLDDPLEPVEDGLEFRSLEPISEPTTIEAPSRARREAAAVPVRRLQSGRSISSATFNNYFLPFSAGSVVEIHEYSVIWRRHI